MTSASANVLNAAYPISAGYNGAGVRVGIISDSWAPQPALDDAWVIQDGMGHGEGYAMAELVRDVASEASLSFCAGDSEVDGAIAIYREIAAGCRVIACDMFYPGDNSDMVAAIDYAAAHGVLFMSSAGNYGIGGGSDYTTDPNANPIGAVNVATPIVAEPWSSVSQNLRFVAPDGIMTDAGRPFAPFFGTSAAVASAAGLAALVMQAGPRITPAQAVLDMQANARPVSSVLGAGQIGAGLPNATLAVGLALLDEGFVPRTGAQVYAANEAQSWVF